MPLGGSGIYVLDTSILVLSLRGDTLIRARLASTTQLYIASIALDELYFGAYGLALRLARAPHWLMLPHWPRAIRSSGRMR